MRYSVDFGDHCKVFTEKQLVRFYKRKVDKSEYRDMSDWMWDMMRLGLIVEII